MKHGIFFTIALAFLAISCSQKQTQKAIDVNNMDLTINPAEDFYKYANGGWMSKNEIPSDKPRYSMFDVLNDLNVERLQKLIGEIISKPQKQGSDAEKIAMFYNSGMDSVGIDEAGIAPIQYIFDSINNISSLTDLQDVFALLLSRSLNSPFWLYCDSDGKNSQMNIVYIEQGGLRLPEAEYYSLPGERFQNIRAEYKKHITKMLIINGVDSLTATKKQEVIYNIESKLASISMDKTLARDPNLTYNKMSLDSLNIFANNIKWDRLFDKLECTKPNNVIVSQTCFVTGLNKLLTEIPLDDWKTYLHWNVLSDMASYIGTEYKNEDFNFFTRFLDGQKEPRSREKDVIAMTNSALSDIIGKIYVEKYFPPEAKTRMNNLVANLRIALSERIAQLDWMSDSTKAKAQEKLNAINVKIGYPNKWRDYTNFIPCNNYATNILKIRQHRFKEDMKGINQPVDKDNWYMSPQTVNAYYAPNLNEIVFPAAILQPPFFHLDGDDAVNYGAIGVVIGHEITHGFDDSGKHYDKNGNLCNWWTDKDLEQFNNRAQTLINRFNSFVVIDTMHANGEYTIGENIADLGGLNIAYTAFTKTEQWKNQSNTIDGFTPNQRFFIAYAQCWGQLISDEFIVFLTQNDVHSLGCNRVEGPLPNVDAFVKAFNVQPGNRYYLPDSLKTRIW